MKYLILLIAIQFVLSQTMYFSYGKNRTLVDFHEMPNDLTAYQTDYGYGYDYGFGFEYKSVGLELNKVHTASGLWVDDYPGSVYKILQEYRTFQLNAYYQTKIEFSKSILSFLYGTQFILSNDQKSAVKGSESGETSLYKKYQQGNKHAVFLGLGIRIQNIGFQIRYTPKVRKTQFKDGSFLNTSSVTIMGQLFLNSSSN